MTKVHYRFIVLEFIFGLPDSAAFFFVENIKIFSKLEDSTLVLYIYMYGTEIRYNLKYKKFSEDSFYSLRYYSEAKWFMDKMIPMIVFASSCYDEFADTQTFCGTAKLSKNDDDTIELLNSSPHYYVLSYRISEIDE